MSPKVFKTNICLLALAALAAAPLRSAIAQTLTPSPTTIVLTRSLAKYLDPAGGMTVDQLVRKALESNGELIAMRREVEAGEALIQQARLRPNPSVDLGGSRQIGGSDNSLMVQGELPLELGGRRSARIRVAERELGIRRQAFAERERQLAAEVRSKFGEALAAGLKLNFTEETIEHAKENFELVAALVTEGRRPPLEQSMEAVELNRMRAMRETAEGAVEMRMFELRNLVGMT
ncbi:MAG: TolC family protein, partial [Pyrinomonadaceae bacterium]